MRNFVKIIFIVFILLAPSIGGASESVQSFMQKFIGGIRETLKAGDVAKANELFVEYFDMNQFGKLCLVDHWDKFSQGEQFRYIDLFDKNLRKSMREKMLFTKDDTNFQLRIIKIDRNPDGTVRVANTLSITRGDFGLVLFLTKKADGYHILDYELEGALLSRNYRGHFSFVIDKYGKAGFFNKLETKLASK